VNRLVQHPLMFFVRLTALVAIAVLSVSYVGRSVSNDEVLAVLPWFWLAMAVHIAPPFVVPRTDILSPPGLASIQGGLAITSMLAAASLSGGPAFSALGFIATQQRIELTRLVMLLLIVTQVSYLFGYYVSSGALFARVLPRVSHRRWDGRRLVVAIVLSSGLFVVVYALFQQQMGGSLFDVSQLARGRAILRSDPENSWMARGIAFGFVPVILLACAAISARSRRMLVVSAVLFVIVALLVSRVGQRGAAAVAGLSILVVFHFLWRRLSVFLIGGLLLFAVVSVNILGEYRQKGTAETSFSEGMSKPVATVATHEDDRQRLTVLGVIMHTFPERHDYLLGESYYGLVASLVPRWLWPDKGKYFVWRDTAIVYNITGLPAPTPMPGVLFANFSWAGVVIGMALLGAFHRGLYRYVEDAPSDPGTALIYIAILGSFTPTLLGVSQTLQWAVPVVVLVLLVSRAPAKQSALAAARTARGASGGLPVVATTVEE
jgi:hypothetical protein